MVHYKKANTAINQHEWKVSGEIIVHRSTALFAKAPKQKKTLAIDLLLGITCAFFKHCMQGH
jgi:hypothetical protein